MYNFTCLDQGSIFYFGNTISQPKKYIEHLENLDKNELSHSYVEKWRVWNASNDASQIYGEKKHIVLPLKLSNNQELNNKMLYVINAIKESAFLSSSKYTEILNIGKPTKINNFAINKYYPGQYMGSHVDSYGDSDEERFTALIYLNDDYEGGEIEFPKQNIKFKPEAGSVLIFPTKEPYYHQSHTVKSGFKYFVLNEFGLEK